MMTNDMGTTEQTEHRLNEAAAMGMEVLPPDVNESQVVLRSRTPDGKGIRFGLAAIKGVGAGGGGNHPQGRARKAATSVLSRTCASGWIAARSTARCSKP